MNKLKNALIFGIGYVFGAQAGRARYEQLRRQATRIVEHPTTQHLIHQAQDVAREKAGSAREKVGSRLPASLGGTRRFETTPSGSTPSETTPTQTMPSETAPPAVIDLTDASTTEEALETRTSGGVTGPS